MFFSTFSVLTTYQQLFSRTGLQTHKPWRDSHPGLVSHQNSSAAVYPCVLTAGHRLLPAGSYQSPASLVGRHGSCDNCYVLLRPPVRKSLYRRKTKSNTYWQSASNKIGLFEADSNLDLPDLLFLSTEGTRYRTKDVTFHCLLSYTKAKCYGCHCVAWHNTNVSREIAGRRSPQVRS